MMNDERFAAGCYSCEQAMRGAALPIRERIYADGLWRVAHAFNSALPSWLVLLPQRHVFHFLKQPETAWVPTSEMDRIGVAIAERLQPRTSNE